MSVYDTDLYMDLFDYYSEDMPYGTVHATDGDPVQYISDELDELGLMDEKVVEVDENLEQSLKKAEADLQSQKDAIGDKELETMLKIAGLIKDKLPKKEDTVDEDINEELDRASVTLDMVKPALEKLLMSYKADQKEYYDGEAEAKAELKAKGMSDEEVERELMQGDPYDYSYIMIDDIEDSIEALEDIMKNADADGDDIAELGNRGPQDTSASEKFMQDIKYAIKGDYPELFGKLFMYDIGESEVEESVTQDLDEACSLKCKECGDMLGEPTTDCQHDSQDPKGENWIMVDLDGDGDDDLAVKNEDINYQSEIDRILGLAGLK